MMTGLQIPNNDLKIDYSKKIKIDERKLANEIL